jgi:hypothetical protein
MPATNHRQRAELWTLYNGPILRGEHARVFPTSSWAGLGAGQHVAEDKLEAPSRNFADGREVGGL